MILRKSTSIGDLKASLVSNNMEFLGLDSTISRVSFMVDFAMEIGKEKDTIGGFSMEGEEDKTISDLFMGLKSEVLSAI